MDNAILQPPPVISSYSIARDRFRRNFRPPHRYGKIDLVVYGLNAAEGVEFNEKSYIKAFCNVDSVLGA